VGEEGGEMREEKGKGMKEEREGERKKRREVRGSTCYLYGGVFVDNLCAHHCAKL
jgi:hypothetical protein